MTEAFPDLNYKPTMPLCSTHGIAIVGAGSIVNYGHLPAYKQAGFKVMGITDSNLEKAAQTAREFGIAKIYASLDELLEDPDVEIVDVAVYPAAQTQIVKEATSKGKHLLCQKPLASTYSNAVRSVEFARKGKVK